MEHTATYIGAGDIHVEVIVRTRTVTTNSLLDGVETKAAVRRLAAAAARDIGRLAEQQAEVRAAARKR